MNEFEKVVRVEVAMRTMAHEMRQEAGPDNLKSARALDEYVQNADASSKLRLYDILTQTDRAPVKNRIRAVS